MADQNNMDKRIEALEKAAGKSDKKKGFGTFSSGHKFSAFGGTSTDLTLGSKTSMYAASTVSCGIGYKSDMHAGTTVSYTMGPDWEKWQKPGASGKAKNIGRGALRAIASKFDFSTVKSHSFNISTEGSTDLLTKKVFLNKGSFEAYSGYDTTDFAGAKGKLTYDAYVKSMERVGWALIASNLLPTAAAVGQSLASMDENGNRDHVYGGVDTAGAINAYMNGVTAVSQVTALIYALMQKDKFKDNIVPKQAIVANEKEGIFLGTRYPKTVDPVTKKTLDQGSSVGIQLNNKEINLAVSEEGKPFGKVGEVKNFCITDETPSSKLILKQKFGYLYGQAKAMLEAGTEDEDSVTPYIAVDAPPGPKIIAKAEALLFEALVKKNNVEKMRSSLNLGINAASLLWKGRTLSMTEKDVLLAFNAFNNKKNGQTHLKSYVSLNKDSALIAYNDQSKIILNKNSASIQGASGKSITLKKSGVVICGELKVQGNASVPAQKVVLDGQVNNAIDLANKQSEKIWTEIKKIKRRRTS